MLLPLFILPTTTIFCICFSNILPSLKSHIEGRFFRSLALISLYANLFYSVWLWLTFPRISALAENITMPAGFRSEGDFVFQAQHNLSLALISLSSFVLLIGLLAAWYSSISGQVFAVLLLLTEICLIGAFSCTNIFMFLLLFELSAMPIFLLISYAGSPRRERIKASYYFIGFTLYGSLALFLVFLNVYAYFQISFIEAFVLESAVFWILLFVTFSVKVPLFPFHTWLPYAHVEASTTASIILAALLLKLGGFAIIKFLLPVFSVFLNFYFQPIAWVICLVGLIYAALCALRQIDMKRQIAFSSISHMSFAILSIFTFSEIGLKGGFYLMISHGLTSAILFYLVGMLSDRSHSRSVFAYSGLLAAMPVFVFFLVTSSLANVGFPGTSGFLPELFTLVGILSTSVYLLLPTLFGMFLSTASSLLLVLRIAFGHLKSYSSFSFSDATRLETFILGTITTLILWLGLSDPWVGGVGSLAVFSWAGHKRNPRALVGWIIFFSIAASLVSLLVTNAEQFYSFLFAFSTEIFLLANLFFLLFNLKKYFVSAAETPAVEKKFWGFRVLYLCVVGLVCQLLLNWVGAFSEEGLALAGHYSLNVSSIFQKLFIIALYLIIFKLIWSSSSNRFFEANNLVAYWLVLIFSIALLSTDHFVLFFIAIEGLSLTLYILPVIDKTTGGAAAAAKYFAFGTLGSIFILWGIANVYAFYPSLIISELGAYISSVEDATLKAVIEQNIQFIFIGLLIKLGAAPGHFWVPDVYAGSPLRIMLIFSTFVKAILFLVFWRIATSANTGGETELAAVLSIIVGCFYALRQKEIKRFLAYSSIAHTGFLLLGDVVSSALYLVIYLVSTILFFSILLEVNLQTESRSSADDAIYLTDLKFFGDLHNRPLSVFFALVALASMAGIPPFGGFYIKLWVFTDLVENIALYNDISSCVLFVVALGASIMTMLYYIRIANYLLVGSVNLDRWLHFIRSSIGAIARPMFGIQVFSAAFLVLTIAWVPLVVAFFTLVI